MRAMSCAISIEYRTRGKAVHAVYLEEMLPDFIDFLTDTTVNLMAMSKAELSAFLARGSGAAD